MPWYWKCGVVAFKYRRFLLSAFSHCFAALQHCKLFPKATQQAVILAQNDKLRQLLRLLKTIRLADTCPVVSLTSSKGTAVKVLGYVSAGWIAFWVLLTACTNAVFKWV
ncbi:hypothetical protein M3Y99_00167300 [Aphelenchoides fujianensis]|nr:hypothetical protein M3Y99_00167300 [Aphelenchoides fujianensis]